MHACKNTHTLPNTNTYTHHCALLACARGTPAAQPLLCVCVCLSVHTHPHTTHPHTHIQCISTSKTWERSRPRAPAPALPGRSCQASQAPCVSLCPCSRTHTLPHNHTHMQSISTLWTCEGSRSRGVSLRVMSRAAGAAIDVFAAVDVSSPPATGTAGFIDFSILRACLCVRVYACACACAYAHAYTRVCSHTDTFCSLVSCVAASLRAYNMYTYIHTYMCAHTHTPGPHAWQPRYFHQLHRARQ